MFGKNDLRKYGNTKALASFQKVVQIFSNFNANYYFSPLVFLNIAVRV